MDVVLAACAGRALGAALPGAAVVPVSGPRLRPPGRLRWRAGASGAGPHHGAPPRPTSARASPCSSLQVLPDGADRAVLYTAAGDGLLTRTDVSVASLAPLWAPRGDGGVDEVRGWVGGWRWRC
jgi:hypothetical protein